MKIPMRQSDANVVPLDRAIPATRERDWMSAEITRLRDALTKARDRIVQLERLADQDSLVPAFNRRAFVRELDRWLSFKRRYGANVAVLFFDLNHMKTINDTLGHSAGDAALARIAELLRRHVRETDIVGRLGGDEYAVLLMNAGIETARAKASDLAQCIRETAFHWQGWKVPLDVAYGAYEPTVDDTAEAALHAADQVMYERKEQMRAERRAADLRQ